MNTTLQTEVAATEVVIGAPVFIMGEGKTATERALSVVRQSSLPTALVAASMAGKVGRAAREGLASHAPEICAKHVLSGNYKTVAETLFVLLDEAISFGSAAEALPGETHSQFVQRQKEDFMGFGRDLRKAMAKLPQTTKSGKPATKYTRHVKALQFYMEVCQAVANEMARRKAAREEREAQAQGQE